MTGGRPGKRLGVRREGGGCSLIVTTALDAHDVVVTTGWLLVAIASMEDTRHYRHVHVHNVNACMHTRVHTRVATCV